MGTTDSNATLFQVQVVSKQFEKTMNRAMHAYISSPLTGQQADNKYLACWT